MLLNFVGILQGKTILKGWRWAILSIAVFTAFATPAADVVSMFLLAIPMVFLYFVAVFVALWHDRVVARRARGVRGEPVGRMTLSPAERYAAARLRRPAPRARRVPRAALVRPGPFQEAACGVLEQGRSVLVAAPTGAGKTIVAEFAVHLALAGRERQGLLHDADEGAQQPEVLRARGRSTAPTRSDC